MKIKILIPLIGAMLITSGMLWPQSQRPKVLQTFVATTEEEVFEILDRMIDSMLVSKQYINPGPYDKAFVFGYLRVISSRDTIMIVKQGSTMDKTDEKFHTPYLSNCQSVVFYGRLLDYFKTFKNIDPKGNYRLARASTSPLYTIRDILIKQYESGKLSEEDKAEAFKLIEQATLRLITVQHYFVIHEDYDNYVTDNIRQALIDEMEDPFYPTEYLDYYMKLQRDTLWVVDTVGIADTTKEKIIKEQYRLITEEEQKNDVERYNRYLHYKELGKVWGGLSPGEAYLEERRREFWGDTGYVSINTIAEYAYRVQDTLLIEHLRKFKEKHPDYPLEYF